MKSVKIDKLKIFKYIQPYAYQVKQTLFARKNKTVNSGMGR